MNWRAWGAALAAVLALGLAWPAAAEDYPSRPITLIVPFPAGAGGVIGTRLAARATPDGYTLVMAHTGTTSINPTLYANPGYDPRKDLTPIGLISSTPIVLMAHLSFAPKTIGEVIAFARSAPGKLNIGTPPMGTGGYLSAELFKAQPADAALWTTAGRRAFDQT